MAVGLAVGAAVGVGLAVGAGVGVGEAVAAGVGDGVAVGATPVIVIRPLFCGGEIEFRSVSMNSKSFGKAAQTNGLVFPGVLLTRSILIS